MRFWAAVVLEGEDYAEPLFRHQESFEYPDDELGDEEPDETDPHTVSRRCSCTWARAAEAAADGFSARVEAALSSPSGDGPPHDGAAAPRRSWWRRREPAQQSALPAPGPAEVLARGRAVDEVWQLRMATMFDHPDYGRADPACPDCSGTGRVEDQEFEAFDYFGEPDPARWPEVLAHPCRTPRVWPWGDDLLLAFQLRFPGAAVPTAADLHPEAFATLTADELGAFTEGVVPVARFLDRDLVPDVLGVFAPDGRWLERETIETAEDLASWHARLQDLLSAHPAAQVAVVDFHA